MMDGKLEATPTNNDNSVIKESDSSKRSPSPVRGNDEKFNLDKFFQEIIDFKKVGKELSKKPAFILVNHFVPTLPPFIKAIEKLGRIALIVPKGGHKGFLRNDTIKDFITKHHGDALLENRIKTIPQFKKFTPESINDQAREIINDNIVEILNTTIKEGEDFLVIDIGGYFAPSLGKLCEFYPHNFLGIVEDTENGHQAYDKILSEDRENPHITCPLLSVARSPLKKTEDYNVGKAIVESAGVILRTDAHTMLERMDTIGVLGFGKIGRSISEHLRQKNIKTIIIYDKDPIRQMEASSLGFSVTNRKTILERSDMLFCATGNKSLESFDFCLLKDNVFVASCTSSDTEFDLSYLKHQYGEMQASVEHPSINKYYLTYNKQEKRINLLCNGDAVNFVHNGVNGPYIYSVQAGLIVGALALSYKEVENKPMIGELSLPDMEEIAHIWLRNFDGYKVESNFHIEDSNFIDLLSSPADSSTIAINYFSFANNLHRHKSSNEDHELNQLITQLFQLAKTLDEEEILLKIGANNDFFQSISKLNKDNLPNIYLETARYCLKKEFFHFCKHLLIMFAITTSDAASYVITDEQKFEKISMDILCRLNVDEFELIALDISISLITLAKLDKVNNRDDRMEKIIGIIKEKCGTDPNKFIYLLTITRSIEESQKIAPVQENHSLNQP